MSEFCRQGLHSLGSRQTCRQLLLTPARSVGEMTKVQGSGVGEEGNSPWRWKSELFPRKRWHLTQALKDHGKKK